MNREFGIGNFRGIMEKVEQHIQDNLPKPLVPVAFEIHSYENREFLSYVYDRVEKIFQKVAEVSLYKEEYFKNLNHRIITSGTWRDIATSYKAEVNFNEKELISGGEFIFNPYVACHESDDVIAYSWGHEIAHFLFGDIRSQFLLDQSLDTIFKDLWSKGNNGDKLTINAIIDILDRGSEIRADLLGFKFMQMAGYHATVEEIGYDLQNGYNSNLSKYVFWDTPHSPLYVDIGMLCGIHHPISNFRIKVLKEYGGKDIPLKVPTVRFYDYWELQKEFVREQEKKIIDELYFCHPKRSLHETAEILMNDAYVLLDEMYEENKKNIEWFLNAGFEREWYVRQVYFLDRDLKYVQNGLDVLPLYKRLLLYHEKLCEIKMQSVYFRELLLKLLGVDLKTCLEEYNRIFIEKVKFLQVSNASPSPLWAKRPDLDKLSDYTKQFYQR